MLRADIQAAFREIRREPWSWCATVAIIALAIASATAFFAVVDGLLLRPLPFHRPDSLASVMAPPTELSRRLTATQQSEERDRLLASASIAGGAWAEPALLVDEMTASAEGTRYYTVSPSFFTVLGAVPLMGVPPGEHDRGVEPRPAVIGHDLWQARFGGDPAILGRTVRLQGREMQIRAVMPQGFEFPGANVWTLNHDSRVRPPNYVRLAEDVTVQQLAAQFPRLDIVPIADVARPREATALAFLFVATVLLVIVAWVQVISLQVTRATGRTREIGIRLALGATRPRLLRAFAAEGVLLAAAGVGLAWLAVPALTASILRVLPPHMLRGQHVAADLRTLTFTCVLAALGVIVAVLVPHQLLSHVSPISALRGDTVSGRARRSGQTMTGLLFLQLATSAWLLYLAGLATHSVVRLSAVELGFDASKVLTITLGIDRSAMKGPDERRLHVAELTAALKALPGVSAVGHGFSRPLTPGNLGGTARLPLAPAFAPMTVRQNLASPDFFRALGVRFKEGRAFDPNEGRVAIINEAMAKHVRPHGPVLGQVIQVTALRGPIVGVVEDYVDERPDRASDPQVIFHEPTGFFSFALVRASGDPAPILASVRETAQRVWGAQRVEVSFMNDQWRAATTAYRGRATLLAWLAVVGVSLSLIGLAGAMTSAVRRRRRELAVRLALGAPPSRVRRLVFSWALTLSTGAALTGILTGVAVGRWARSLFFEVAPLDTATGVGLLMALGVTTILAAWLPARRAAAIDPAVTLRD